MSEQIMHDLAAPFPREVEKTLVKSGVSLTYIPVSEIITRLNKVLGIDSWSLNIIRCERDAIDPDYIVAHVRLTWLPSEPMPIVIRDGIGGQKIKRSKTGEIIDLGDEMKGAVSDALKKAAQSMGIGLYLARRGSITGAQMPTVTTESGQVVQLANDSHSASDKQKNYIKVLSKKAGKTPPIHLDRFSMQQAKATIDALLAGETMPAPPEDTTLEDPF